MVAARGATDSQQRLPVASRTLIARRAVLLGAATGAAAVTVLHLVRPEMSAVGSRLSAYAVGPHGWLMGVAFVALGVSAFGFSAVVLTTQRGWVPRMVGATAAAAGVGLVVSAMFPTGVSADVEVVHSRASALATVGLTVVAGLASLWPGLPGYRGIARQLAAGGAVVMAVASPFLHHSRFTGLSQRLLWLLLLLWLAAARNEPS